MASPLRVCIDGEWHELDKFGKYHPGGRKILEDFNGCDATEAFYALHSKEAIRQLKKRNPESKERAIEPHPLDKALRELANKLEKEGYFERTVYGEMKLLIPIFLMVVFGTYFSYSHPFLATIAIGVAMQQAGWLGHDMDHARNSPYCKFMLRYVSGWINGFDRSWWSDKHNAHHVLTNHVTLDPDIHNQPFLFLWAPSKALDHHFRCYQHFYFLPLYSFLYVSWRTQSITWAWAHRDYKTLLLTILPSYIWLACLPLAVSVGSVLLGGLLVALVVTLSHESEDILFERETCYTANQFLCTRDVICPDPITEYLFGGMQYQLEHHIFPFMPRYKNHTMVPIIKEFAAQNGLKYKADGLFKMFAMHWKTLRRNALAASQEREKSYELRARM